MSEKLNRVFKICLDVIFYIGVLIEVTTPFTLRKAVDMTVMTLGETTEYAKIRDHYVFAVISIMMAGAFALLIIRELRKMMKTVIEDNCFVQENVDSLRRMGTFAFVITLVKVVRCFVYFTPGAVITAGVFGFAGILSKVLSKVFDRAVSYKEENDLTI
jgi:hypothetical protein